MTVTLGRPSLAAAGAEEVGLFLVDSISSTQASGRATASGCRDAAAGADVGEEDVARRQVGQEGEGVADVLHLGGGARSVMRVRFIDWLASRSRSR